MEPRWGMVCNYNLPILVGGEASGNGLFRGEFRNSAGSYGPRRLATRTPAAQLVAKPVGEQCHSVIIKTRKGCVVFSSGIEFVMSPIQHDPAQTTVALKPPQFRLRTMLLGVALVCVLLVVMISIGMFWAMGLLMLILLIVAHVVGNSLGTQLRDHGSRITTAAEDPNKLSATAVSAQPWQRPLAGRMQEKEPVGWLLIALSVIGAIASGIVGGLAISSLYWDKIGAGGIVIATLAAGVIGGMAVFLTGTFIDMVRRVWREATAETSPAKKG
jgi:hypothetical protein